MLIKRLLVGALLAPSVVFAQGVGNATAAFESVADNLFSVFPFMIGVAVVLAIVGLGLKLLNEGSADPVDVMLKFGVPLGLVSVAVPLVRWVNGGTGSSEQALPEKDTGPSGFAVAWSWFIDHLVVIGLFGALVIAGSWLVSRALTKRGMAKQVKFDVKDLLETIERADALVMYWEHVVLPQSLGDGAAFKEDKTRDTVAQLKRIQDQLLGFLEIAHAGAPLNASNRARLTAIREELNGFMKSPAGKAFDIAGGLAQLANSPVAAPAAQPEKASLVERGLVASPRFATTHQVVAVAGGYAACAHSSVLDPLNPLSPLSPISPWSIWSREEVHHHAVDNATPRDEIRPSEDVAALREYSPSASAGDSVDSDSLRSSSATECVRSEYEDRPKTDPDPVSYGVEDVSPSPSND
ncbi:hypothetical protein [Aquabacterium sp. CECT 9606]|uniref:hypothetical protein n=1 Tax=Aquabacterium sp. CECT 9606 TaxID=2845822 RepID=UPI001E48D625|nr:hypothetical protein [Aquabacterium sp. CECT 9606]CAH0356106.1 hypothetical protein AQB9606_04569 [Aquabacterium sp. CECT 9606]